MDIRHLDEYQKLGLNIAYYRKRHGYTQEEFAEALNVSRITISKIEIASVGISMDLLFSMSALLNIPVHKFLEFRD